MSQTDEKTFTELVDKIAEPIRLLNQMLSNKMVSFKRMTWDEENKRQVVADINKEIELQTRIREDIKLENAAERAKGDAERKQLVSEGLKSLAQAQEILKKTKELANDQEKRLYLELTQKINEAMPEPEPVSQETEAPKRVGRPPKQKAA